MKLQRKNSNTLKAVTSKINLELTIEELSHLRDLMSVLVPPHCESTLSEELAKASKTEAVEEKLWQKVYNYCKESQLSVDSDAPDFVISMTQHPELSIYKVDTKPLSGKGQSQDNSAQEFELYDILMNKKKI